MVLGDLLLNTPANQDKKWVPRLWQLSLGKDGYEDQLLCSLQPGEMCPQEGVSSPGFTNTEYLIVKRKVIREVSLLFQSP